MRLLGFLGSVGLFILAGAMSPGLAAELYPVDLILRSAASVSGLVVDSAGTPVAGVRFDHAVSWDVKGNIRTISVQTDAEGRFRFETYGPAMVLRRDGYESQFVRIGSSQGALRIVLKAAPAPIIVPKAVTKKDCVDIGWFCLPKVKGVSIGSEENTIDTQERQFTVGRSRTVMIWGRGFSWGGAMPRDVEVWSSVEYEERFRLMGATRMMDARGRRSDGMRWRHIGQDQESIDYHDAEPAAAARVDQMLDGMFVR